MTKILNNNDKIIKEELNFLTYFDNRDKTIKNIEVI